MFLVRIFILVKCLWVRPGAWKMLHSGSGLTCKHTIRMIWMDVWVLDVWMINTWLIDICLIDIWLARDEDLSLLGTFVNHNHNIFNWPQNNNQGRVFSFRSVCHIFIVMKWNGPTYSWILNQTHNQGSIFLRKFSNTFSP